MTRGLVRPVGLVLWGISLAGCGAQAPAPADDSSVVTPARMSSVTVAGITASAPCLVFRDLNHDGRPDLVLAPLDDNAHSTGEVAVYLNRGGGVFQGKTIPTGLDQVATCAAADYDNDGWPDLAIAGRSKSSGGLAFLVNKRSDAGDFINPATAPLPLDGTNPSTVAFLDADADGWLDVLVAFAPDNGVDQYVKDCDMTVKGLPCTLSGPLPTHPPRIFHGEKGLRFTAGTTLPNTTTSYDNSAGFIDWNGDGSVDIFESIDFGQNVFRTPPAFADLLGPRKANPYNHAMGVAFGDFDKNGHWDFYVAETGRDQLYLGGDDGALSDQAGPWGVDDATQGHVGWSPVPADLNNDGWVDLFVVNSALAANAADFNQQLRNQWQSLTVPQADFVLLNQHTHFEVESLPHNKMSAAVGVGAAASADYDGDGLLDIAVVVVTGKFEFRLLHNETAVPNHHWLGVKLVGTHANRDGAGAFVVLRDGDHELDRRAAGTGGLATSSEIVHFGLGTRTSISSLEVHWPGGHTQVVAGPIAADAIVQVTEQ